MKNNGLEEKMDLLKLVGKPLHHLFNEIVILHTIFHGHQKTTLNLL